MQGEDRKARSSARVPSNSSKPSAITPPPQGAQASPVRNVPLPNAYKQKRKGGRGSSVPSSTHKAPEAQQPGGLTGILQTDDSSVVKLGDASVASPFTSKSDSIANSTVAFLQFNFPFFFNNHPRSYCYRATRALYISYNLADVQNPCAELPYPSVCSICSLSRWGEVS